MAGFLYIDESKINLNSAGDVYSVSALYIPIEIYSDLRSKLYDVLNRLLQTDKNILAPLPELHFCDFLPNKNDETKISVLHELVLELKKHNISIFRVGYFSTNDTKSMVVGDEANFFYQLCWFGIQNVTANLRKNGLMIPVVDAGFDKSFQPRVDGFGHSQKWCNQAPSEMSVSISIPDYQNIAEVSYADSNFSIFTQIIDCISGMRNETLRIKKGIEISPYKTSLEKISQELNALIGYEEHITLNIRTDST